MVDMRAPEKPHFLQPVLHGHANYFLIPNAFFKYLNGRKCGKALLRSSCGGKLWPVKIDDGQILEGWREFAEHHDLHVGDFLVFRYEGDMVFDCMVFDQSTCEKEFDGDDEMNNDLKKDCRESVVNGVPDENKGIKKKCDGSSASKAKLACFLGTVRPSYVNHLFLPLWFTRISGLGINCSEMIVRDESGKLWPIKLSHRKRNQRAIAKWRAFKEAKGLAEGENFTLEVIEEGRKPVLQFRRLNIIGKKVVEPNRSSASIVKASCFVGTMRPSYATKLVTAKQGWLEAEVRLA